MNGFLQNSLNRVIFLYGNTRDDFLNSVGIPLFLEEILHEYLKNTLNYDQIALVSHQGVYFLDNESHSLFMNRKVATRRYRSSLKSPGGISFRKKNTNQPLHSLQPLQKNLYKNLNNFTELVPLLRSKLKDSSHSTAVIFKNIQLTGFSGNSPQMINAFAALLTTELPQLSSDNPNKIIFILNEKNIQEVQNTLKHNQLLANYAFDTDNKTSENFFHIGSPEEDEVELALNYYRHCRNLKVKWTEYHEAVKTLAIHLKSCQGNLKELLFILNKLEKKNLKLSVDNLKKFLDVKQLPKGESLQKLQKMVGLKELKNKVVKKLKYFENHKKTSPVRPVDKVPVLPGRIDVIEDAYNNIKGKLHLILKGNPGTGKTTIANLIGNIYRDAGILSSGHTVKATRDDLVAGYVGQTALKTRQLIDQAMGGVLFIDEAYTLVSGSENDFGAEALATILEAMSDYEGQFMVIMAGYPNEMDELVHSNPGFKRRFENIITIEDFTAEELEKIFKQQVKNYNQELIIDAELETNIENFFRQIVKEKTKNFGNAGTIIDKIFKPAVENVISKDDNQNEQSLIIRVGDLPPTYQQIFYKSFSDNNIISEEDLKNLPGFKEKGEKLFKITKSLLFKSQNLKSGERLNKIYIIEGETGSGRSYGVKAVAQLMRELEIIQYEDVNSKTANSLFNEFLSSREAVKTFFKAGENRVSLLKEASKFDFANPATGPFFSQICNEMQKKNTFHLLFITAQPGFSKKLLDTNYEFEEITEKTVGFRPYKTTELLEILEFMAEKKNYSFSAELLKVLYDKLKEQDISKGTYYMRKVLDVVIENYLSRADLEILKNKDEVIQFNLQDTPKQLP